MAARSGAGTATPVTTGSVPDLRGVGTVASMDDLPSCGHWMPRANEPCGRKLGHTGRHMPAAVYERRRAQAKGYDKAYRRDGRRKPESREQMRARRMRFKYAVSPLRFARMIRDQGGLCAVCRADLAELPTSYVHIDHDHGHCPGEKTCGKCVRGIVCMSCNNRLRDYDAGRADLVDKWSHKTWTPELIQAVHQYLADPPAQRRRTVQVRAA
jgi:Recombination endonuclease VII